MRVLNYFHKSHLLSLNQEMWHEFVRWHFRFDFVKFMSSFLAWSWGQAYLNLKRCSGISLLVLMGSLSKFYHSFVAEELLELSHLLKAFFPDWTLIYFMKSFVPYILARHNHLFPGCLADLPRCVKYDLRHEQGWWRPKRFCSNVSSQPPLRSGSLVPIHSYVAFLYMREGEGEKKI